jgi:hypothetical protein
VTKYVITISPEGPAPGTQITLRVDLSSGRPRVEELLVRPPGDRGLGPTDLSVDVGLLLRAFIGDKDGQIAPEPDSVLGERSTASVSSASAPVAPGGPAPRDASSGTVNTDKPAAGERAPRREAARATGRRIGGGSAGATTERPYRRMPDPEEMMVVYQQYGTITGLAEHFGVPRHTAQGWASRLRRAGFQLGHQANDRDKPVDDRQTLK